MSRTIFITGVSSGIGEELQKLLEKKNEVFSIGRSNPNKVDNFLDVDLSNSSDVNNFSFPNVKHNEIWLINNAGIIGPIEPIDRQDSHAVEQVIYTNLIAPMLLTTKFMNSYSGRNLKIINVSSGAAFRPILSWSSYCTSKAGLEMFSNCIQVENDFHELNTTVYSIAPGVVDTEMQAEIRSQEEGDFPDLHKFKGLKTNGELVNAVVAAETMLHVVKENPNGGTYSLRDFY